MAGFKDITLYGMLWLAGVDVQSPDKRHGSVVPVLKRYVPKDILNMDGIHSSYCTVMLNTGYERYIIPQGENIKT